MIPPPGNLQCGEAASLATDREIESENPFTHPRMGAPYRAHQKKRPQLRGRAIASI